MDTFEIWPTSASSAECAPIVLRETDQRRLAFKPTIVDNTQNPDALLRGTFVYQRKRKAGGWEDRNELPLTKLRADEWVRLDLSASEVQDLLGHLAAIYRQVGRDGIPKRRIVLLKVDLDADEVAAAGRLDLPKIIRVAASAGYDVVNDLLAWLVDESNAEAALLRLRKLSSSALEQIGALSAIAALEQAVVEWEQRLDDSSEEFWQQSFRDHAWVLSTLLAHPLVVVKGKVYVGGKSITNTGGNVADFAARNPVTGDVALLEIKTPRTKLLGSEYRNGVFPLSGDLSGAIAQVLRYRHSLLSEYRQLVEDEFEVFRPRVVVIGGNAGSELTTKEQRRSFELGRGELKDIVIVTYDELITRARRLLEVFTGATL